MSLGAPLRSQIRAHECLGARADFEGESFQLAQGEFGSLYGIGSWNGTGADLGCMIHFENRQRSFPPTGRTYLVDLSALSSPNGLVS